MDAGSLTIVLSGTPFQNVGPFGIVTTAKPVVAYDMFLDDVLYGISLESPGASTHLLFSSTPLSAWRSLQLHEHSRASEGLDSLEDAERFVEDLFDAVEDLEGAFPPASDVITLWDNIPSVRIRAELAWDIRRALGTGTLVDDDGEVRRRIDEFAREQNTFPC